jgi:hypothetical protein
MRVPVGIAFISLTANFLRFIFVNFERKKELMQDAGSCGYKPLQKGKGEFICLGWQKTHSLYCQPLLSIFC